MTFPSIPKAHLSSQALTSGKPYNHLPGWRAKPLPVSRDELAQEDKVKAEPAKLADLAPQTKVTKHCQHQRSLAPFFLEKPHRPVPSPSSPGTRETRGTMTLTQKEKEKCHTWDACHWDPCRALLVVALRLLRCRVTKTMFSLKRQRGSGVISSPLRKRGDLQKPR